MWDRESTVAGKVGFGSAMRECTVVVCKSMIG